MPLLKLHHSTLKYVISEETVCGLIGVDKSRRRRDRVHHESGTDAKLAEAMRKCMEDAGRSFSPASRESRDHDTSLV